MKSVVQPIESDLDSAVEVDGCRGPFDRHAGFLMELGRALHVYGSPAHRLEAAMKIAAQRLGLGAQFFATPTAIMASFESGDEHRSMLVRVDPGEVDLERLSLLDGILGDVARGELGAEEARARVRWVVETPQRFGSSITILSFVLASASAARLMGGGLLEIAATLVISAVVALLLAVAGRLPGSERLIEPLAAIVASALATLAAGWIGGLSPLVVTMASLIVLLPGLTVTVAITELATRHLVSGSARLWGAMVVFLTLAFGVALGSRLGEILVGPALPTAVSVLPAWTEWVAWIVAPLTFTVLFRAHPRDSLQILWVGVLTLASARLASGQLGAELGAFFGALVLGLTGNLLARLLDRPSAVTQLPGLVLLVPGSLGFQSLAALVDHETVSGIQTAFSMSFVAIALATGLLVAGVVIPPRSAL
jgi:uncharacterized membrane protein YjjP (DUF1212 family)